MPAASSKTMRRSTGFSWRTASIFPCSRMARAPRPPPVSMNSSRMSFSRVGSLLTRYSLVPSR